MAGVSFSPNRAAIRELLVGNSGPVAKDLALKAQRIANAAKRRCPADTGRLRQSIRWQVRSEGKTITALIGTDVAYAIFVHEGTKPHWPPLKAMQPWAKRHGFPEGNAGAYLVAGKIAAQGTKARPFLKEALEAVGVG